MINPEIKNILEAQTIAFTTAYSQLEAAVNAGASQTAIDVLIDRVYEAQDQLDHTMAMVESILSSKGV